MLDIIRSAIGPVAKAVAAFVTPFIVALLVWVVERTGVDVPYDAGAIEAFIVSVVSAALVWLVANRPKT